MDNLNKMQRKDIDFEYIFDLSSDLIFILDAEHNILCVNRTMADWLGVAREELIGKKCFWEMHQADKPHDFCAHVQMLNDGQAHTNEIFIEQFNGWFTINVTPMRDNEGNITGSIHIARETTQRKKAEKELLDSTELLSLFVRHSPLFTFIKEIKANESRVLHASENFTRMIGIPWDGVVGRTMKELFPDEFAAQMTKDDLAVVTDGVVLEKDEDFNGRNYTTVKFPLVQGDRTFLAGYTIDMTDRKQSEIALKNSLSMLDATLESIHNGILVVNNQGTIIKTNRKFAELWHLPGDAIATADDKELLDLIMDQLAAPGEFMTGVKELYAKPEADSYDFIYFRDGRIFERISKPMYIGSAPVGRVWSFLDVTERIRSEKELLGKNEQLNKANAEKDMFFSIIAHDLRSPFMPLLGFTRLLSEDLPSLKPDEIQKIALGMNSATNKLFSLLENLLEWSRMQRGLIICKPELFLLRSKLNDGLGLIMEAIHNKEIDLRYDISDDLTIFTDGNMFESILRNLVSNAVKFTGHKGKIIIAAKPADENRVEISIMDTGIGMNKEMTGNLFNLDFNTNRKGTDGEPSTGLGLVICKEFIEKNGGKIWVESEEGKGSTFYFTLLARNIHANEPVKPG